MRAFGFGLVLVSFTAACSSSSSSGNGSACTTPAPPSAAAIATSDSGAADGGVALAANGDVGDPGGGGLYLTASGEALAVTGYDFPPANADATFLVDG
ncbi:MAG TPA: hypothetical protein VH142_05415, partial [Polyangiaceae bacterium]|nr:hypothetical protein [Polyangiaceae bacterium]